VPRIFPFVGLRFDRERVGSFEVVTAPPYDVISQEEHARYLSASPYNVIRLDLAETANERPGRGLDPYREAARSLSAWRDDGVLVTTDGPAYYPYEMRFRFHGRSRRIRGLICALELEEWGGGIVPHERTMRGPVEDRLRLMRAIGANPSCIYAVFAGPIPELARWLEEATSGGSAASLVDDDGVEHGMWVAPADAHVATWLGSTSLMIADGHHRYATALRYRDEIRARQGPGPWDRVMMFLVDAATEDPPVLPFHRIAIDGSLPTTGTRVGDLEEVLDSVDDRKLAFGTVAYEGGALVHRVAELVGEPPVVSRLHEQVLAGPSQTLRFTPDAVAAEDVVRRREATVAYLLPPTNAETIRSVVELGHTLPQKSTFFWPKPRTGMVMRPLEDE
jgi:uncharacterized protein (DUF1015 family)